MRLAKRKRCNVPGYLNLTTQLSELWGFDLNQLHHVFTKYKMQLCIYLPHAKIFKTPTGTLTINDIEAFNEALNRASSKKLKDLGYAQTVNNGKITSSKGNVSFSIAYQENKISTSISIFCKNTEEIQHDGFLKLSENIFLNPNIRLDDLFNKQELKIIKIQSASENHENYLDAIYAISLRDVYVQKREFERVSNSLGIDCNSRLRNESEEKRNKRYQIKTNQLLQINPKLLKIKIAEQIYIEETNFGNSPPTVERIKRIIRVINQRKRNS